MRANTNAQNVQVFATSRYRQVARKDDQNFRGDTQPTVVSQRIVCAWVLYSPANVPLPSSNSRQTRHA